MSGCAKEQSGSSCLGVLSRPTPGAGTAKEKQVLLPLQSGTGPSQVVFDCHSPSQVRVLFVWEWWAGGWKEWGGAGAHEWRELSRACSVKIE